MANRILEFDTYTDDTAPGYGWSLETLYTTALAVGLIALTVAAVRVLEVSAVGAAINRLDGTGVQDAMISTLAIPVILLLFIVGRYAGVRGVDSESLPAAVAGTAVTFLASVLGALVFVEIVASYTTEDFYVGLGVMFGGMVLAANVLVLAMDRDLSDWEDYPYGMLFVMFLYGFAMIFVWSESTNGLWWELFKLLRGGLFWVLIPLTFFTFYIHDAWRNAERGLGPTRNALATYVAVTSVVLFPLDLVYAFVTGD